METGFKKLKRLLADAEPRQLSKDVRISRRLAEELAAMSVEDWLASSFISREEAEAAYRDFQKRGYLAANNRPLPLPGGERIGAVIQVDESLTNTDLVIV